MLCLQILDCKFECFKVARKSYFYSLTIVHILNHPREVGNFLLCPFTVQENSLALILLGPSDYDLDFAEIEWIHNFGFLWTTRILGCVNLVQDHRLILII